jgi:integrase
MVEKEDKKVLTDTAISKFRKPSAPKQEDHWDGKEPAFGVRVSYSGTRTFIVMLSIMVGGKRKLTRVTVGRYDREGRHGLTLAQAREKAREFKKIAKKGDDPRNEQREHERNLIAESVNTFASVRDSFLDSHRANIRSSTAAEYERLLKKNCAHFDNLPIAKISRQDIRAILSFYRKAGKPYAANRTFAALRVLFSWAVDEEILDASPADGIGKNAKGKEKVRNRVLSNKEISVWWRALDAAGTFAPMFKLLLLTGQRRGEVAGMRRSELSDLAGDDPQWRIPEERTKNGRPHMVHLSPAAVEIIKKVPNLGDMVFTTNGRTPISGFSKAKERVENRIAEIVRAEGLEDVFRDEWRIHDLRRTLATHMGEMHVHFDIIELLLNHVSGLRAGITSTYNLSQLMADRRGALNRWGEHLQQLTTPQRVIQVPPENKEPQYIVAALQ